MVRQYSISDARNNLPSIVKQVEYGPAVELTRRGRPVAVLISHKEYERLNPPKPDLWTAIQEWREKHNVAELDLDPDEIWGDVRDRSPGRDFRFDD